MNPRDVEILNKIEDIKKELNGGLFKKSLFSKISDTLRKGILTVAMLTALIGASQKGFSQKQDIAQARVEIAIRVKNDIDKNIDECKAAIISGNKKLAEEKLNHLIKESEKVDSKDLVQIIELLSKEIRHIEDIALEASPKKTNQEIIRTVSSGKSEVKYIGGKAYKIMTIQSDIKKPVKLLDPTDSARLDLFKLNLKNTLRGRDGDEQIIFPEYYNSRDGYVMVSAMKRI